MTRKKKEQTEKPLTEVELELMNIVWQLGPCTVKDVLEGVAAQRELAYTSVATMLKILEQKGILKSSKGERALTYEPLVSKAEYESASLQHLAKNVFAGDPSAMVMRLIDESRLSQAELEAIRELLDERLKK
jgi:predicted transcriptional regulator